MVQNLLIDQTAPVVQDLLIDHHGTCLDLGEVFLDGGGSESGLNVFGLLRGGNSFDEDFLRDSPLAPSSSSEGT